MTSPARFLDIHVIQTIPYANLNRDDLGSPKTLVYGGVTRARVSSQCWKRATRLAMHAGDADPAVRTRRIVTELAGQLTTQGWDPAAAAFAGRDIVTAIGVGLDDQDATKVMLFLTRSQFRDLAEVADAHRDQYTAAAAAPPATTDPEPAVAPAKGRGKAKKAKPATIVPTAQIQQIVAQVRGEVALFGRFLAELPTGTVDGAVQVAHAFAVHRTDIEIDFFTAVDDLNLAEDTGSAHMGTAEHAAATLYRYATVDLDELTAHLGNDRVSAAALAARFAAAFAASLPSGKKRSTAPNTVPELVYVAARDDRPVSLATAVETPVPYAPGGGYVPATIARLADHAGVLTDLLGVEHRLWHAHAGTHTHAGFGTRHTRYSDLVDAARTAILTRTPDLVPAP